jgi:hypothetical protein
MNCKEMKTGNVEKSSLEESHIYKIEKEKTTIQSLKFRVIISREQH